MSHGGSGRPRIWEYYDRRADEGIRGFGNALAYWSGLGVNVAEEEIRQEAHQMLSLLRAMPPATFVEVGAGPGTFTADLPGNGIALDQSDAALRVLRSCLTEMPVVRADALRLPFPDRAFGRVFAAHIYGLLEPGDRRLFMTEARRVAPELVIIDAGRPDGVPEAHWQERTLGDGQRFTVFRRHFDSQGLAHEISGRPLFSGQFYVMASA